MWADLTAGAHSNLSRSICGDLRLLGRGNAESRQARSLGRAALQQFEPSAQRLAGGGRQ